MLRELQRLPRIVVVDGIAPLYDGVAPAAVVRPDPDVSGLVDPYMVTLCPRVATRLGWRPDPRHVFTYLDTNDQVVAWTIYWRDGGISSHPTDTAVFRYGYALVLRKDRTDDVRPYLAAFQVSRAWRLTVNDEGENRLITCGSRVETGLGFGHGT